MIGMLLTTSSLLASVPSDANDYVELPLIATYGGNDLGVFEIMLMGWDRRSDPNPVQLQVILGGVRYGKTHLGSMAQAFDYAVERTPSISHTGTVSVQGVTYRPAGGDGPSAGAAMAVGFIAMFKGDRIQRGTAITGTLEPGGHIGWVGGIPDKIRAAKREGCHAVLVPRGQTYTPQWNLVELGFQLNIIVKEVDTVDDAYLLMTGKTL
ncbi:MAG TPA: S16 family serine protease [Nitrospira sp.]|nr:S16 family serine protease [Nitrospira sp.]